MDEIKQNEGSQPVNNNQKRKKNALIVFAVLAIIGAIVVYFYLQYKSTHISTDDAFIDGHVHTIASKVPGTVKTVYVNDNQQVRQGDILVEIDQSDYDVKVSEVGSGLNAEKAKRAENATKIEVAIKQLSELTYRLASSRANLEVQEANLRQADIDLERAKNLLKKEAISKDRFDRTKTAYDVSAAQVKSARDQIRQIEASIEAQKAVVRREEASLKSQEAVVKQREASLMAAELNKGYTKMYAPSDGYITKKSVEVGNQIGAGQPLMAVVPLSDIWVMANYKETQLEKVRPGQKVDIKVDTYPGKIFKGKVQSIMAGTGAVFSLFPPENATGNYVKVVQRIPVKVVFDKDADPGHVLRMGMSVEPTVIIRD